MVEGDDPGDATSHVATGDGASRDDGALPTCGGDQERYAVDPARDRYNERCTPNTGWKFFLYDRAIGKVVAVCHEEYMAARLCKKLNEHERAG